MIETPLHHQNRAVNTNTKGRTKMSFSRKALLKILAVWMVFVQTLCVTEARPTDPPACLPGQFYDDIVFTYRPCSICFTEEGQQFQWNCNNCNCARDKPSTTTTISILTSTVTLPSTLPENKTKNQTGFSVIPTPTKLISRVPVTNSTSTASDEISEADQWKLPVIIIGCIVGLCVMIVGVIICCYRWYSSRSRNEDTTQGCCSIKRTKRPLQCTNDDGDSSFPSTPCMDVTIDVPGYRVQPYRLVTSGKHAFFVPATISNSSMQSSIEETFV
ncbi:uncharacterized protein LOC110239475 [Exaiptasia diaphana]|uniref:Uncharacterized protein n=1 Tax=Exaiptasia diaphana TaxID=2652724 RepID=A0A913XA85_EXADI|nr:uncharacterized protein LOC110239475 [Exaiptasia diaphana]